MTSELPPSNLSTLEAPTIDIQTADISSSQSQTTQMENPPTSHITPHTIPLAVTKTGPTTIEDLPNELLVDIFSHLDSEAPSSSHTILHDQPTLNVTNSSIRDLKDCSVISKRWRQATLPLLFKYTRYILKYSEDDSRPILNDLIGPFLQFIHTQSLADIISSFTLVVREKKISNCLDGRPRLGEFDRFWQGLFQTINPSTILIAAPVEALASLTSAVIKPRDLKFFEIECHYLRLQRPADEHTDYDEHTDCSHVHYRKLGDLQNYAMSSEIFHIRPWSSLLLNEGSNLEAYKSRPLWGVVTPSILQNLLGDDVPDSLINSGIRSMEYIAIFPMSSHFQSLVRQLPRLDHLYCQLVPRNNILQEEESIREIQIEDLWMERNDCYAKLLREKLSNPEPRNYKYLKTFESGDAADADAWELAVEFVKHAGLPWKVTIRANYIDGHGMGLPSYLIARCHCIKNDPKIPNRHIGSEEVRSRLSMDRSVYNAGNLLINEYLTALVILPLDFNMRSKRDNLNPIYFLPCNHNVPKSAKGRIHRNRNKVSRRSQIIGTTNIILGGKTVIQSEVIIRGDLLRTLPPSSTGEKPGNPVAVAIGRYCFISRGAQLRPPGKIYRGTFSYFPLKIGDHVYAGPGSIIEAAMLGNHVHIGANVVVGKFVIVKDFVKILDGTVVPAGMVIPSFSVVGGIPGRVVGEMAEGEIEGMDLREIYRGIKN
ncbi:dynactin [Sclerotinia borealis F-4128]|uniref:Dynactin subunit 5 n=1 Tax=Sclerotinia borealis (strain F-4128) TaxID=1432307 RepID=W9CUG4_SCLBF|nr:dynactin [Sclerotinia borealis F-4128]